MDHPKILSTTLPNNKVTPFGGKKSSEVINKILNQNFKGTVKNNSLIESTSPLFVIEKLNIGLYKIIHNIGYENLTLSIALLAQPGSFEIKEHSPVSFTIQTVLDKVNKDLDFMFSITRVISPAQDR